MIDIFDVFFYLIFYLSFVRLIAFTIVAVKNFDSGNTLYRKEHTQKRTHIHVLELINEILFSKNFKQNVQIEI